MTGTPGRRRADLVLVARGVFPSRARARVAIEAGLVRVEGVPVARASDLVDAEAAIEAGEPYPWVSRGGVKLAAALDAFAIDPQGLDCLDVGASTGGFTDVLLARGARSVHAVDVGRGQFHPRLAADARVSCLEATDIRDLGSEFDGRFDLATVDVSFISLRLVLPRLGSLVKKAGQVIALVKPQFEVGRGGLGKGGIVKDEKLRLAATADVLRAAADLGLIALGTLDSPVPGGDGNREILFGARRG